MSSPDSLSSPPHSPEPAAAPAAASEVHVVPAGTRLTASGAPRKKPGPKPKPKDPNAPEKKPRKPRKPAEPKDPHAEPAPRKRGRAKASLDAAPPAPVADEQKPMVPQHQHASPAPQANSADFPPPHMHPSPATRAGGASNHVPVEPIHSNPSLSHMSATPSTPRPASSGQRYDPIRGGIIESKPAPAPPPVSPPLNRASASPSITSLIDPPTMATPTYPAPPMAGALKPRLSQQMSVTSAPQSPVANSRPGGTLLPPQDQLPTAPAYASASTTPMDIDSDPNVVARSTPASVPMKKTHSNNTSNPSHSNAPTPPATKPARPKEAPPLPTGSGLLSGTPFGPVAAGSTASSESQGANIYIKFTLKPENNVINFAKEAEKQYGFAALHPKIAARKERLRQVTAAGAAIERAAAGGSTDDMSLDLSEAESNADMGGMEEEGPSAGEGVKKRRKRKQEDYDKEDDFIDDTELAWADQALMAKDGFFVYMGPITQPNENPHVERVDGTVKRGRGRGRGGTTRGEASGRGRGRGGGPGSRGGNTVRKPRVTKADRQKMEQEKLEREQMGATLAAAKQTPVYNSTPSGL